MADGLRIREADAADPTVVGALSDVLIDCVAGGASVGFMAPLARDRAAAFWRGVFDDAARGGRVVLIAEDPRLGVVGTVQVVLSMPDNQPHRAEMAKMLVRPDARRRGIGAALMRAAESRARDAGRTLLVLDTAAGGDAERLYARLGWQRCGAIPGYALLPHGGLCGTTLFYRDLTGVPLDAGSGGGLSSSDERRAPGG